MNTFEMQEHRAQQAISWPAVLKTGFGLGLYLFIFSGGAPWFGAGVANGVLGRTYALPWLLMALMHFGLCVLFMAVIGAACYRFSFAMAVPVGAATAIGLYLATYPFLATHNAGDGRAFAAYTVLGLFGSAIYKAISVPKIVSHA